MADPVEVLDYLAQMDSRPAEMELVDSPAGALQEKLVQELQAETWDLEGSIGLDTLI